MEHKPKPVQELNTERFTAFYSIRIVRTISTKT